MGLVARGHTTPHGDIEILPRSLGLMADLRRSEKNAGRAGDEVLRISEDGRLVSILIERIREGIVLADIALSTTTC